MKVIKEAETCRECGVALKKGENSRCRECELWVFDRDAYRLAWVSVFQGGDE